MFVGCLTSQQHASVSQGRICEDSFTCCHTEIEVADPTFHLTQSQYTDTGPTSPSADPITPGARQGSHWSANVRYDSTRKKSRRKRDSNPGPSALEADALTTRPTRRFFNDEECLPLVSVSKGCAYLLTYLCPSLPMEHRPSTTPRHRTLFWAALAIPAQLVVRQLW